MRYKREESFRFQFEKYISAYFSITEVNGNKVSSHEGHARLVDLSPHGLKLEANLDIPMARDDQIKMSVRFILNESEFILIGKLVWIKKTSDEFFYGIKLDADENLEAELINELKAFAKLSKTYR